MKRIESISWTFLPGLILLAGIGSYALIRTPFTLAEMELVERLSAPFGESIGSIYGGLYLGGLKVWSAIGENHIWLRISSLLCGLLALPLAQRVVRNLGGVHAVPGALVLLGGAPLLVVQASRVGAGTSGLLVVLTAFACFLELVRDGDWRWLVGWLAALLVGIGIHVGFAWVAVAQWLVVLVYRERVKLQQAVWWAAQVPLVGWIAWRYGGSIGEYAKGRLGNVAGGLGPMDGAAVVVRLGTGLPVIWGWIGALIMIGLLVVGLRSCRDWRRDLRHGLLVCCLVVPCLLWLLLGRVDAYLLMPLVCWCTLVSMGLRQLPRWGRQMVWGVLVVVYLWSYWRLLV